MTTILLTGATGQLGWELNRALAVLGDVRAPTRTEMDLAVDASTISTLDRVHPEVIVNAAAYTAVDRAESEPELAAAVNTGGPRSLATWARERGAMLVHYSTEYVFDGAKEAPYIESDAVAPLSTYGKTKLAGERAVQDEGADHLILRTSWLFAARGRNFLRTILRKAREEKNLRVVDDQVGAPTWARLVAEASVILIARSLRERQSRVFSSATYHLAAGGSTSWHGFAETALERARRLWPDAGWKATRVAAVKSSDFAAAVERPANSRLNCERVEARIGLSMPPWDFGVRLCLAEMKAIKDSIDEILGAGEPA
jgi:dTDP-4-dehydrorhamnose reductase